MEKATLITGASAGLGYEFAKLFAKDKQNLVLVARRTDKLQKIAEDLRGLYGIKAFVISADLEDPQSPKRIFAEVQKLDLEINHLVNNAGFGYVNDFMLEDLQKDIGMINVNISSLVELTKLFAAKMVENKSGKILNIGSTAGFQPGPYMATYYATKAFVNSFSEALSHELRHTGVTVTLSCPGPTQTEFGVRSGADKKPLFKMGATSAEQVAREAYSTMQSGERRVIHGLQNTVGAVSAGWMPNSILLRLVEKLQGK